MASISLADVKTCMGPLRSSICTAGKARISIARVNPETNYYQNGFPNEGLASTNLRAATAASR